MSSFQPLVGAPRAEACSHAAVGAPAPETALGIVLLGLLLGAAAGSQQLLIAPTALLFAAAALAGLTLAWVTRQAGRADAELDGDGTDRAQADRSAPILGNG